MQSPTVQRFPGLLVSVLLLACASDTADSNEANIDSSGDEIVGGTTTSAYSYVVAVGNAQGAFCSGTVVSKRTVVTAAHCAPGITRVFFGPRAARPTASIAVVREIAHPGYDENSMTNDVAVLALASDAPVQPAPLLREGLANNGTWIGPDFTFVGYGITNGTTGAGFGVKRVVKFPIAAVGPARVGGTAGTIDATQFYYRTAGKNTCSGDSGGPAFATKNGVLLLAGVTSYGDGPCRVDGVQQRTDANAIRSFIQPLIDQIETGNACKSDGRCNESCNTGGQVRDPDCHQAHCGRDNICSLACTADPDC
jgi:hypothetical protein